jgi:hypothetical protein
VTLVLAALAPGGGLSDETLREDPGELSRIHLNARERRLIRRELSRA